MDHANDRLVRAVARATGAITLVLVMFFASAPAVMGTAAEETDETTYFTLYIGVSPYDWIGTTSPPPGWYEYVAGTTAILTAVQTDIWVFLYWVVVHSDATSEEFKKSTIKVLMDEDHWAVAYFGYKGGPGGPTKP